MKTNDTNPEIIDAEPEIVHTEPESHGDPEIEEMVDDLVGIGRMWAHHGMTIGKMALKSSAKTMEVTAGVLEKLARRVAPGEESKA